MSMAPTGEPEFRPAPAAIRLTALQLLSQDTGNWLSARQLLHLLESAQISSSGLWIATRGERLVGAVLGQVAAGKAAVIWPPGLVAGEPAETAVALLRRVVDWIEQQDVALIQAVIPPADSVSQQHFEVIGFTLLADLMYLASSATQFPADEPRTPIEWRPSTDLTREELAQLVEATYEETLDCPALSDCRDVRDALVGYEKTGTSSVEHWRVARLGQNYIGCLLLADHPESDHLELVYMGLLRRYRGRHRSRWFVQTAQWMASQIGRSKLVLAVDSRNVPARKIYESEELWEWGRRRVLFRVVPLSRAETNRQERDG